MLIIEEHFESGGLFEFIAGIFVKTKSKIELVNLCLDKKYIFEIFDREILLENNGINLAFLEKWIDENE